MTTHRLWKSLPLLFVAGLLSCTPPIWNKMQKQAALPPIFSQDDFAHWQLHWVEESELPGRIRYLPDQGCLDIVAPKGLTLWYDHPFQGNLDIRYQIRAVDEGDSLDRCSDLNCFWMASDPGHPDSLFARKAFRNGQFGKYYSLALYYVGYGGNGNTTTRFRRYDGNYEAFLLGKQRPPVQQEYTDSLHLIVPNHWYDIQLQVQNGRVRFVRDGDCLFDWVDAQPLDMGWFGFRTTQNHLQIRRFRWSKP